jgi:hypothetical protein
MLAFKGPCHQAEAASRFELFFLVWRYPPPPGWVSSQRGECALKSPPWRCWVAGTQIAPGLKPPWPLFLTGGMYRLMMMNLPLAPLCISTARASNPPASLLTICWDLTTGDVCFDISQEATPRPLPGGRSRLITEYPGRVGVGLAGISLVSCRRRTSTPGSHLTYNQWNNISYGGLNAIHIPLQDWETTSNTTNSLGCLWNMDVD